MSNEHNRLPFPVNPHWDGDDRQVAEVVARIAQEAVDIHAQFEAQGVPMLQRTAQMAPILDQWMAAIEDLYDQWEKERAMASDDPSRDQGF